jgi:hypothetical protein
MTRALCLALLLIACKGGDTAVDGLPEECGDPDGEGGDTGDVPGLIGDWTASYGQVLIDSNCPPEQVPKETLDFLKQPFYLDGAVPAAIRITFDDNSDLRLRGPAAPTGGLATSGAIEMTNATLYTAIGGMVYTDSTGRVRWDGAVFIGADLNGDTVIDCDIRTDWKARKSGG